ncbi:YggS family pyridoxal phosphate-dependent enzyme, partial [Planctomycetota bacterium]
CRSYLIVYSVITEMSKVLLRKMQTEKIIANIQRIRGDLPADVKIEAAAKTRSAAEVHAAIEGGVDFLGYNYVQEGLAISAELREQYNTDFRDICPYHLIGPLQKNKIGKALELFSIIETVDSPAKAEQISNRVSEPVDVLLQVNVGSEDSKSGALADSITALAGEIGVLPGLRLKGLMTIEPYEANPEQARPWFRSMRELFENVREHSGDHIQYLSMGMSHSYMVAVEEGANIVRIGTGIFGSRS